MEDMVFAPTQSDFLAAFTPEDLANPGWELAVRGRLRAAHRAGPPS